MLCLECGENLEENVKFCSKCGTSLLGKETPEPEVAEQPKEGKFSLQFKLGKICECATTNNTIAMSPDGKYLATATEYIETTNVFFFKYKNHNVNINIWDISTFKKIKQLSLDSNSDKKISIAFSPDSKYIVVSIMLYETKYDKNNQSTNIYYIPVYKIESGNIIRKIYFNYGSNAGFYNFFSFSPDGEKIIGTYEGKPRLWEADDGQVLKEFQKPAEKIIFHPNEKKLISFYKDEGITIWDENSAEEIGKIAADKEGDKSIQYNSIVCSADGQFLAAGNNSGKIFIWNFKSLELVKRLQVNDEKEDIKSVSFYPNLNNIIAFSTSDSVIILDTETEKVIEKLNIDNSFWVSFTLDGQNLLVASGGIVIKWNVIKRRIVENGQDI